MAALIGALRATLSADTAKFEAGMKRAQRVTNQTSSAMTKSMGMLKAGIAGFVGALSVGMLTNVIKNALDYAGSLGEVSQQLGVTTRDLQVFRFVANQNGVSTEEMDKGLLKLTVTLGQVAAGAKAPIAALKAIGITADELKGKDTGEAFRMIADGLQKVTDRSQRAAVEVALFGRTGAKLDNVLAGGSSAINNLAQAAEELGIVLSDRQIQDADKTADKLDAMKTVLSANIAGQVANNAEAILGLANALMQVVVWAGKAASAMATFLNWAGKQNLAKGVGEVAKKNPNASRGVIATLQAINPALGYGARLIAGMGGGRPAGSNSVTTKLAPARVVAPVMPGLDVPEFLAGGGGRGGRGRKDNSAEEAERARLEALRRANEIFQEQNRAEIDILRAKRDLAVNFDDRNSISVQILDAERAAYKAELDYEVAAKEKTQAEADTLLLLYDRKDALERQKIIDEEAAQAAEEAARYQALVMDLDRDLLESRANLAETASERRQVELELLDFAYRQRKAALDAAIAQEKDAAALQRLTLERDRLMETYANNRAGVIQSTRGPGEDFMASLPTTTAKWQEAIEQVKVDGLQSLEDGMMSVIDGTKSVADAFHDMAKQIIADLIRIAIQKFIISTIANAIMPGSGGVAAGLVSGGGTLGPLPPVPGAFMGGTFALPAFAAGGSMILGGRAGRDRNLLMMNGVPIARVSRGEMMNITPANEIGGIGGPVHIHMSGPMSDRQARRTGMQAAAGYKSEMGRVSRKGIA